MICSSSKQMISSLYLYFNIIIIVTKQSFPSDMIITTHDHRLWFGFIIMNTAYHVFDMFCACAVTKYRYRYSIPSILRPKVLSIGIEMKFVVSPTTTNYLWWAGLVCDHSAIIIRCVDNNYYNNNRLDCYY